MINAGLPILQCLQILAAQSRVRGLPARSSASVKDDVEVGTHARRRDAKKHPKVFTDLYTSLVPGR